MNRRDFMKGATLGAGALSLGATPEAYAAAATNGIKAKHIIVLMNGNGARKLEYFEGKDDTASAFRQMAQEGTVCTEDHGNHVSNHGYMYTEYLTGQDLSSDTPMLPTFAHYGRKTNGDAATKYWYINPVAYYRQWRFNTKYYTSHKDFGQEARHASLNCSSIFYEGNKRSAKEIVAREFPADMGLTVKETRQVEDFVAGVMQKGSYQPTGMKYPFPARTPMMEEAHALAMIPQVLQEFKPRLIVVQQVAHDTGHGAGGYLRDETGFLEYAAVCRGTNEMMGRVLDFVKKDPYFSQNTAIVVRPETGRDDEINLYGEVHHSDGYYYAHRTASIWWGPDFKKGQVVKDVVNRMDMCPTLAFMMGADKTMAKGSIRPHVFDSHVTGIPQYRDVSVY